MADIIEQTTQRRGMTAARRALLEEAFKRACGKKPSSPQDYDYVAELLAQCVGGDPGNPTYVRAYLENLQKKYQNKNAGHFKNRGAKSALKKSLAHEQWDEAIRHGLEVLKANPWDVSTLTQMATAARGAGDNDSELCYLKAALTKAPKDPTCNRMAAVVLDKMGLVNQAIVFWQRVAEALPRDKEAQWAIREFQIGAKSQGARRGRATEEHEEAVEEKPAPAPLHIAAGPEPEQLDLAGDFEEKSVLAEAADAEDDAREVETPKAARKLQRFDVLLLSAIGVMLLLLLFLLPGSRLWPLCLSALDVRGWHWPTWTGVGAAAAVMFMTIYFWPERKAE
jgi:tetratricopeptide (TPR) repeat protein